MASKAETVMAALQVALETNHAGTAHPPDKVQRMLDWPDPAALDSTLQTIYLVRGINESTLSLESCSVTKRLQVVILAAHRYESLSENPFFEDPPRDQVSIDLAKDIEEKLRRNEKLGLDGVITTLDGGPFIDYERYWVPNWVIPHFETFIRYRYEKSER